MYLIGFIFLFIVKHYGWYLIICIMFNGIVKDIYQET